MKLDLLFSQDGKIIGDGSDDVGAFLINGVFDSTTLEVRWTKGYMGQHRVEYLGVYNQRSIAGSWNLNRLTGGFRIWPGESADAEEATTAEELEQPEELVLVSSEATAVRTRIRLRCSPGSDPLSRLHRTQ